MTKRLTLLLLLALPLTPLARADDATKATKINELFALTHVDHLTDQMANQMLGQMNNRMKQETAGSQLTPKQNQIMSDFTGKIAEMIHGQLSWNKVKPQFVTLYASTYTEPEIDSILAFYRSPAGQTMMAKLPELNAKSLEIGQAQVGTLIPQLRQMSEDFSRQMSAAAAPPTSASPSTAPATKPAPAPAPAHK